MGDKIIITIGDKKKEYDSGVSLLEIADDNEKNYEYDIALARTNGRLREISKKLYEDTKVEFFTTKDQLGNDTYRRSMALVMLKAYYDVFGKDNNKTLEISFSLSKGLFCRNIDETPISEDVIARVKERMKELVSLNLPITKNFFNTIETMDYYKSVGLEKKANLLNYRRVSKTNSYTLDDYVDYFYGFMLPFTGKLKYFDLFKYDKGFVLQMPICDNPTIVPEFEPQNKIFNTLMEAEIWADKVDAGCVGDINDKIVSGQIVELIYVQEALFERKVVETVNKIIENGKTKVILIAGPSSSGKTTFSHRLSIQLKAAGFNPNLIAVDNYFVNREDNPVDENGNKDYECIGAIDTKLLNDNIKDLLDGKKVEIPRFDFVNGKRFYKGDFLQMKSNDILILEGIHCLNEELTYALPKDNKFKIYISALTQLNVDEHNRIATTDWRLLRRIARDAATRGIDAQGTIGRWASVRKGEEKHIFPYQEQADVVINSALIYEISALKHCVEPLLFKVDRNSPEYDEAKRLLKFLDYFLSIDSKYIPSNSIVREFIGDGCFEI